MIDVITFMTCTNLFFIPVHNFTICCSLYSGCLHNSKSQKHIDTMVLWLRHLLWRFAWFISMQNLLSTMRLLFDIYLIINTWISVELSHYCSVYMHCDGEIFPFSLSFSSFPSFNRFYWDYGKSGDHHRKLRCECAAIRRKEYPSNNLLYTWIEQLCGWKLKNAESCKDANKMNRTELEETTDVEPSN